MDTKSYKDFLLKRVPQNPKYQHVKSRLDTGLSLTKYMERLEEIKRNYRYRKDEIFKRLKVTTFAQMVLQVATLSDINPTILDNVSRLQVSQEGDHILDKANSSHHSSPQPVSTTDSINLNNSAFLSRSTLQSVISGVGELDVDKDGPRSVRVMPLDNPSAANHLYPDCPYLLLDVRDQECYNRCHIISAHSYPIASLSRAINPYTKEVLDYKNAQGKIIIVYDEDERLASQAASTMCERGFENLFMLSGGLKVIAQKFPEGMTIGPLPVKCILSPTGPSTQKCATLHQTPQLVENKWRFTSEDLNKIQHYLDEVLIPSESSNRVSSRMSTTSSNSKVSSAQSSRLSSARSRAGSPRPWK